MIRNWRVTMLYADGGERIEFIRATTPWHAANRGLSFVFENRRMMLTGLQIVEQVGSPEE